MDANSEHPQAANANEEDLSNELVQRIRKLRWMGMEEEAERLQAMLRQRHPADTLLSGPCETD